MIRDRTSGFPNVLPHLNFAYLGHRGGVREVDMFNYIGAKSLS